MAFEWGSLGIGNQAERMVALGSHFPVLVLLYMLKLLIIGGRDESEPGVVFLKQLSVVQLLLFAIYMICCTRCTKIVTAIRHRCGLHSKTVTFLMSQCGLWLAYLLFESITIYFSCVRYDKCPDLFPSVFLLAVKLFMKNATDKSLAIEFLLLIPLFCLTGLSIGVCYLLELRRRNLPPCPPPQNEIKLVGENATDTCNTNDLSSVEEIIENIVSSVEEIIENVVSSVEEININDEKERLVESPHEDALAPTADGVFRCCNSEQTACAEGSNMNSNGNLPTNDQLVVIHADNEDAASASNGENEVISVPLLQPAKILRDNHASRDLPTDAAKVECKARRRKGKSTCDSLNETPQRKSARLQEKQQPTKK